MTETAAPKPWQHGYALDALLAIEAIYADYNRHSVSPFSAMKKNTIAQLLHEQRLRVVYAPDGAPLAALSVTTSKVASPIYVYNDVELARKQPGDLTLAHIAGDHEKLRPALDIDRGYLNGPTWAVAWSEDFDTQTLLAINGFARVGSKVSTFGEIWFVYFREGPELPETGSLFDEMRSEPRRLTPLPAEEYVGIKRLGHVGSASPLMSQVPRRLAEIGVAFTNHYSNYNKGKSWSAIALRGFSADPGFIAKPAEMSKKWHEEHAQDTFALQDTPLRREFPEIDEAIAPYGDAFERIRFMQLAPGGGELDRHTDQVDNETGVRLGNNARIHIPLVTNDKVEFTSWDLDNRPMVVNMRAGEVWYLDTRKPHRAINGGDTARIHLVVDVMVTERFQKLLSA